MSSTALLNLYDTLKTKHLAVTIDALNVVSSFSWFNQNKKGENFQALQRDIAVFFELTNIEWNTHPHVNDNYGNEELGICTFNLHYFRKSLENDDLATAELIDKVNCIHRAINLLNGDNFGNTVRVNEIQDTAHDNVIDWTITYQTQLFEQANDLSRVTVDPNLVINKTLTI
jgi:hypothetical protein